MDFDVAKGARHARNGLPSIPQTERGSPSTANTLSYEDFLRLERGEEIDNTRTWANTARQVEQGLSFGTADEIEAGVTSLFGDETYDDAVGRVREKNEAYQRKNPMRAMALQALGALAGALGGFAEHYYWWRIERFESPASRF